MTAIFSALSRGIRDLFQFRVLLIVIWPIVAAALLWLALGVVFWETFTGWIDAGLVSIGIQSWLEGVEPRWIANVIQLFVHFILFVPLVFMTALVLTALFAMPALIRLVEERHYPQLKRERGGSLAGNLINALLAVGVFAAIWVLTLPLWLIGIGMAVPFVAAAYLNQRMFRYDALAEHASAEEMQVLFLSYRSSWWGLGLLTGLLQFVPLLNLLAPVYTALVFIHFGLDRLERLRQV
ncbi:MAG TPA: EI24 domain-containing protein [Gallionella sp.]